MAAAAHISTAAAAVAAPGLRLTLVHNPGLVAGEKAATSVVAVTGFSRSVGSSDGVLRPCGICSRVPAGSVGCGSRPASISGRSPPCA